MDPLLRMKKFRPVAGWLTTYTIKNFIKIPPNVFKPSIEMIIVTIVIINE